jgi:hypothetical protein
MSDLERVFVVLLVLALFGVFIFFAITGTGL